MASSTFRRIDDNFSSLDQVQQALRREGLESSQLILAVDYTRSNEWTGQRSNDGQNLHHLGRTLNPYEQVISVVTRTLSKFDNDQLIPVYGFGDATTSDTRVFNFRADGQPCRGLLGVQPLYRSLTPKVNLAGPTSFAPAIRQAIKLVADSGGQYHILLLVADGQVTRSSQPGQQSTQERRTIEAIVEASNWPLSIVMIGVGDGPWEAMKNFDDNLPKRKFDNFQFCNATEIFARYRQDHARMEAAFALNALMEIPEQFKAIQRLGLLGQTRPITYPTPSPVPPPGAPAVQAPPPLATVASMPRFICPITQDIMNDPVTTVDGFNYERSAIEQWLAKKNTSPMTNLPLANKTLTPNHALKTAIQRWRAEQ